MTKHHKKPMNAVPNAAENGEEDIRKRAYELYEERGREDGHLFPKQRGIRRRPRGLVKLRKSRVEVAQVVKRPSQHDSSQCRASERSPKAA